MQLATFHDEFLFTPKIAQISNQADLSILLNPIDGLAHSTAGLADPFTELAILSLCESFEYICLTAVAQIGRSGIERQS